MSNPFTITFQLKQHTPIIHFQHDQAGATLRATELKPKLDRFILINLGGLTNARQLHADWFASSNHDSFDYKIAIFPIGEAKYYAISSNPGSGGNDPDRRENLMRNISAEYINETQYFGDNQYIDKEKLHNEIRKGVLYDGVTIKITSFNFPILRKIQDLFPAFIVSENFGTRQTKGFGCFSILNMNGAQIIACLKSDPLITGIFRKPMISSFRQKLQYVSKHYGKLKRGTSFGEQYRKAELWDYLCSNRRIKWEKRKIKLFIKEKNEALFNDFKYNKGHGTHIIDDCNRSDGEAYFYIRALLGLAENYEFMLMSGGKQKISIKDKLKNDSSLEKYAIDRFKSPIRYFITDEGIFLITEKINPELHTYTNGQNVPHDREFLFTVEGMGGNDQFSLKVPNDFNLPDFIIRKGSFGNNLK